MCIRDRDTAKYAAFVANIPYIAIPTALSNDGVCSPVSVLFAKGGRTHSFTSKTPDGLLIDTDIILKSPRLLLQAGVGDMISNYTALYDWTLDCRFNGTQPDDFAYMLSERALDALLYSCLLYTSKRAVKIAEGAAENLPAATLGPLIHNPQFTAELAAKGVSCKDSLGDFLPGETVIFRSHGVGPEVYQAAIEKNLKILDATCPNVRISQKKAAQAVADGYLPIIVGEKNHPEVKSILAFAGKKMCIRDRPCPKNCAPSGKILPV